MTRTLKLVVLAMLVLALAAACGGKSTPEANTAKSGDTTARSSDKGSAALSPTPADVPPTPAGPSESADSEELSVSDRQAGLDNLDSYRAVWKMEWKSTEGDTPKNVSWEWQQEYTKDPDASHVVWVSTETGTNEKTEAMETYRVAGVTYMISGEGDAKECFSLSTEDQSSAKDALLGPQTLGSVDGAKLVGQETVNGIKSRHYRYDQGSIALVGGSNVKGDIWVATDGGFVVKDTATWEGAFLGLATDDKGIGGGSWTWELTEVNQPIAITAPAGCESAAKDMPILPDATEKMSFGDMTSYRTATKLADVAEFYRSEMNKAGWTEQGDASIEAEFANLTFTQDNRTASLMLSKDGDVTVVILNVQKD